MVNVDGHLVDSWADVFSVQLSRIPAQTDAEVDRDFDNIVRREEQTIGPLLPLTRQVLTIYDQPYERRQYALAAHYHGRSATIAQD